MATEPVSSSVASKQVFTQAKKQPRRSNRHARETLSAYLFLAPYLLILAIFTLFVSLYGIGLSLFKIDIGFTAPEFVGFHNYVILFNQLSDIGLSDFWTSMKNILEYVVVIVILQTALALLLAVILQHTRVLRGVFRTIFYIPALISSVATSLIFLWFYNPDGLVNFLLSLVHIQGQDWLNNTTFALPSIMLLNIWTTGAAFMLYFMAALQDVPRELEEAAAVDGANRFQIFWNIVVPLLRPAIFLVMALGTIGGFQMFDQAMFMTNGGPNDATLTPMLEIYNTAFSDQSFGLAAAMSVLLFIVIFIVTLVQRQLIDTNTNNS